MYLTTKLWEPCIESLLQAPLATDQVTGIVLCGGRGLRMGGEDKPLINHQGSPLVQQVLARLGPQVGSCLISANRNLHQYRQIADATLPGLAPILVVTDQLADYQGPLAGIHSALAHCMTPWFVVCPGDAPRIPSNLLANLSAVRGETHTTVAHDGERQQHLHFLGHRSLLPCLEQYLQSGRRSVAGFHEQSAALSVRFSDALAFANLNRLS